MSGYSEFLRLCRLIGLAPTKAQRDAAAVLESGGSRFLVDYGLDNATKKAALLGGDAAKGKG